MHFDWYKICTQEGFSLLGWEGVEKVAHEAAVSPREIKKIAERALVLQSYLLRRAWGVPYAAWSLAMFVTVFVSPSEPNIALRIVVNMAASGTALVAILWEFKRSCDTAEANRDPLIGIIPWWGYLSHDKAPAAFTLA
jgi:hypothetical protein